MSERVGRLFFFVQKDFLYVRKIQIGRHTSDRSRKFCATVIATDEMKVDKKRDGKIAVDGEVLELTT